MPDVDGRVSSDRPGLGWRDEAQGGAEPAGHQRHGSDREAGMLGTMSRRASMGSWLLPIRRVEFRRAGTVCRALDRSSDRRLSVYVPLYSGGHDGHWFG